MPADYWEAVNERIIYVFLQKIEIFWRFLIVYGYMAFLSYGLLNSGVRVILLINYMAFLLLGYKAGNPILQLILLKYN